MAKENAHLHSMVVFRAVFSGQWTGAEERELMHLFKPLLSLIDKIKIKSHKFFSLKKKR